MGCMFVSMDAQVGEPQPRALGALSAAGDSRTLALADLMADLLAELSALPPADLRARLPDLFALIDTADESTSLLVSRLAARAFEGDEGLAIGLALAAMSPD